MRYERDGFSVEAARKKRRPLPQWFLDQPPTVPGSAFFQIAFRDLTTERSPDGPIPWSACMAYARHRNLSRDLSDALWAVIWRMDLAERRWRLDELKRETGG